MRTKRVVLGALDMTRKHFRPCKKGGDFMIYPICGGRVDFVSDCIIHANRHYRYKLGCENSDCPNYVGKDIWHQSKRTVLKKWRYRVGDGNDFRRMKGLPEVDSNTFDLFMEGE